MSFPVHYKVTRQEYSINVVGNMLSQGNHGGLYHSREGWVKLCFHCILMVYGPEICRVCNQIAS